MTLGGRRSVLGGPVGLDRGTEVRPISVRGEVVESLSEKPRCMGRTRVFYGPGDVETPCRSDRTGPVLPTSVAGGEGSVGEWGPWRGRGPWERGAESRSSRGDDDRGYSKERGTEV